MYTTCGFCHELGKLLRARLYAGGGEPVSGATHGPTRKASRSPQNACPHLIGVSIAKFNDIGQAGCQDTPCREPKAAYMSACKYPKTCLGSGSHRPFDRKTYNKLAQECSV